MDARDAGNIVRLSADYDCFPLWLLTNRGVDNVSADSMPLSAELRGDLDRWSLDFDAILNRENPAASGFGTPELKIEFVERGELLARRMKAELGSAWRVRYFDQIRRAEIEIDE